jgi:ATPase subunit of ABC transporter with duplicated ATPase domains
MIDIAVRDLVKSFEVGSVLLDGFSFDIAQGECVGIMGANGCGKTTLFRMLTGELLPDEGQISIAANKKLGLISQIPKYPDGFRVEDVLRSAFAPLRALRLRMNELEQSMTADADKSILREYDRLASAYEEGGGYEQDIQTDKICNGLGVPKTMREREFARLSGGEKTRVNLARLLLEKTDILLLDEPTNHLDLRSVEWLEAYIQKFKGTVLTISHDRVFLDRVVARIIEISAGKAEFYSGNYSFYLQEKQERFNRQLQQYEQEQAKLQQLGYTVERMKGWGINNRALYRRAMSIAHRMERIEKTERPRQAKQLRTRFGEKAFHGDEVLITKGLGKRFGERVLFSGLDLQVGGGERIALLGDNGTGKTTLLRALLGEEPCEGKIRFGPSVKTAYLPQVIAFAHPERTLYDTMLYEKNCTPQVARDRLGAFLFSGEDVFKTVSTLSGGEQSRLRLCMLMDEKVNLLILDEPTNHLDVASREWIEDALEDYGETLIFVSHDRYFVQKFATRIWELERGSIRDYPCGYEKYRAIKEREAASAPQPTQKKEKAGKKSGSKELEKQLRKLEREITALEQLLTQTEQALILAATDYQALSRLMEEKAQQEAALDELMQRWEELAE